MPAKPQIPDSIIDDPSYKPAQKLLDKIAIITGGDSGIGAATAIAFAKEGANVVIVYLEHDKDAEHVAEVVRLYGKKCVTIKGDVAQKQVCERVAAQTIETFGEINILVNNAGTQVPQKYFRDITESQLINTFQTNIFSMFFLSQSVLPFMTDGSVIINTTSVTAYRGSAELIDYSATKGAIVSFTRSLSQNLADTHIRVNAVAPGPIWSPLVATSFDDEKLANFGKSQPLGHAGQPVDVAPAYVYLASADSHYVTGQVIHVNGGEVING